MNNNNETFSFSGRIRSFRHAIDGIFEMLRGQHNAWVHLVATVCVIVVASVLQLPGGRVVYPYPCDDRGLGC